MCAKALADQALAAIPQAADFSDLDAYRKYLTDTLPFNSRETRQHNGNYLVSRYFPGEALSTNLPRFAGIERQGICQVLAVCVEKTSTSRMKNSPAKSKPSTLPAFWPSRCLQFSPS
jgi:hypothetical protein